MSWPDAPTDPNLGGGGRFRAAARRVFGDGENPLDWALPLYSAWGIRVRIHLVFVVFLVAQVIYSIPHQTIGARYMLLAMGGLFVLVLLHEYGHCIACRLVGGHADQILMWPLGGLASCSPPDRWRAHLATTVGGPSVNLLLLPVFSGVLLGLGVGWDGILFNPFAPALAMDAVRFADGSTAYWLVGIWWLHYLNILLLAFNVLVPMYPLDGGRLLQHLLWARMGYRASMRLAATIGLVVAVVLGVVALVPGEGRLLGVALFGGIVCWMEIRRARFVDEDWREGRAGGWHGNPDASPPSEAPVRPSRREQRRREREAAEQVELDRVLAKIGDSGMASLTRTERRLLERATRRRRRG